MPTPPLRDKGSISHSEEEQLDVQESSTRTPSPTHAPGAERSEPSELAAEFLQIAALRIEKLSLEKTIWELGQDKARLSSEIGALETKHASWLQQAQGRAASMQEQAVMEAQIRSKDALIRRQAAYIAELKEAGERLEKELAASAKAKLCGLGQTRKRRRI